MMIVGLTGSIGMGKSTTAKMFAESGIPVNDADAVVHDLYRTDAVARVGKAFPGPDSHGIIDRRALAPHLEETPTTFALLESLVHPLLREPEPQFRESQRPAGNEHGVLDTQQRPDKRRV